MVGNIPNFNDVDILRCFLKIDKDISRIDLVKKLQLGEGTIRTILNILKNNNLITSTQKGHSFNEKGVKILNNISTTHPMARLFIGNVMGITGCDQLPLT